MWGQTKRDLKRAVVISNVSECIKNRLLPTAALKLKTGARKTNSLNVKVICCNLLSKYIVHSSKLVNLFAMNVGITLIFKLTNSNLIKAQGCSL